MNKVSYNSGDGILEIVVRDETGKKIEHFKMNLGDATRQAFVMRTLQDKYGISFKPELLKDKGFFDF